MAGKDAVEFLRNTDKPILYKKGRYGRKVPVEDKNESVELYENCEDGAIMYMMTVLRYGTIMKSTG